MKDKRKITYFLVANWDISKAIHKYVQDIICTLKRHMIHMYIHENLIPKMLEQMYNDTTKDKILELTVVQRYVRIQ